MGFCCLLGYVLMAVPAAQEVPDQILNFLTAVQLAMYLRWQRGQGALVLSIYVAFQMAFLPPLDGVEQYKSVSARAIYNQLN